MSVFKQFTTKDVIITPFTVNKFFSFTGNEITGSEAGIDFFTGKNTTSSLFVSSSTSNSGFISKENTTCVYNNIKQLYYSNYLNSIYGDYAATASLVPGLDTNGDRYIGVVHSPQYDNYLPSTISQSRFFPTSSNAEISVVSIPVKIFGEYILPNTFNLNYTSSLFPYSTITDDGEGNLLTGSNVVGQIFYNHGIAVFTTGGFEKLTSDLNTIFYLNPALYSISTYGTGVYGGTPTLSNMSNISISYSSSFQILETQYKCDIRENEYGYSLNPSLIATGSYDTYVDFVTGSSFTPYITTVGLYNNSQELLVIGKLSQPIPVSKFTDTTIIINLDL